MCTNGIGYADLLFEIHDFDVDTVHYLGLLKSVLGAVDTENYTYGELFNEVNARTGGIAYGIEVFDDARGYRCIPCHVCRKRKSVISGDGFHVFHDPGGSYNFEAG